MSSTHAIFSVHLDQCDTDFVVPVTAEEFRYLIDIPNPSAYITDHIAQALEILNAGATPIYDPIMSKIVYRALISNNFGPPEQIDRMIQELSHQRALFQIVQMIANKDPQPKVQFEDKMKEFSTTCTPLTYKFIKCKLRQYEKQLRSPDSKIPIDPVFEKFFQNCDNQEAILRRIGITLNLFSSQS